MENTFMFTIFVVIQCFLVTATKEFEHSLNPSIWNVAVANKNEFPYIVSIRRTEMDEIEYGAHICGGTLINEKTVVTAAHCMFDKFGNYLGMPNTFTIIAGTNSRTIRNGNEIIRKNKQIFIYPKFTLDNLYHDVAVIILNETIQINGKNTRSALLAKEEFPEGTQCTISGWEATVEPFDDPPDGLQKAEIYILPREECIANLTSKHFKVIDSQFCAAAPGVGIESFKCDSGGPLVCNNSLYGITSGSLKCAMPGLPIYYTDVTKHLEFIRAPKQFIQAFANAKRIAPLQKLQGITLFISLFITLKFCQIIK